MNSEALFNNEYFFFRNSLPSNVLFKFVLSDTTCDIHPMWKLNSGSFKIDLW